MAVYSLSRRDTSTSTTLIRRWYPSECPWILAIFGLRSLRNAFSLVLGTPSLTIPSKTRPNPLSFLHSSTTHASRQCSSSSRQSNIPPLKNQSTPIRDRRTKSWIVSVRKGAEDLTRSRRTPPGTPICQNSQSKTDIKKI